MKQLTQISIDELFMHPNNPRKEVGDVTELAESIKANGLMQNLTVMPGHWEKGSFQNDGYTILIGHRRFTASKAAGLKELPCCVVTGLSDKEQISIMLNENMQREDLTFIEEADGFQMMLDLGDTAEQIAETSGFSKQTVKHRLEVAKLDKDILKKTVENEGFQLRINDLIALEKIKDVKKRNEILNSCSRSSEIGWKVDRAVAEEEKAERLKGIEGTMKAVGIEKAPEGTEKGLWRGEWNVVEEVDLNKPKKNTLDFSQETLKAVKPGWIYLVYWDRVKILEKAKPKTKKPEDSKRKQEEANREILKGKLKALMEREKKFVEEIIKGKRKMKVDEVSETIEELFDYLVNVEATLTEDIYIEFFTGKVTYQCTPEEKEDALLQAKDLTLLDKLVLQLHNDIDASDYIVNYDGSFGKEDGERTHHAMTFLKKWGWTFEKEDLEILKGTHELYTKKEK